MGEKSVWRNGVLGLASYWTYWLNIGEFNYRRRQTRHKDMGTCKQSDESGDSTSPPVSKQSKIGDFFASVNIPLYNVP